MKNKVKELIGKRYSHLIVIGASDNHNDNFVKCRCDCGNEID